MKGGDCHPTGGRRGGGGDWCHDGCRREGAGGARLEKEVEEVAVLEGHRRLIARTVHFQRFSS